MSSFSLFGDLVNKKSHFDPHFPADLSKVFFKVIWSMQPTGHSCNSNKEVSFTAWKCGKFMNHLEWNSSSDNPLIYLDGDLQDTVNHLRNKHEKNKMTRGLKTSGAIEANIPSFPVPCAPGRTTGTTAFTRLVLLSAMVWPVSTWPTCEIWEAE